MNKLKLKNSIFKIFIELFIWDKKLRSKTKARWAKLHLKKYVKKALAETNIPDTQAYSQKPIIWQYWHQGAENAPLLIQKCLESTRQHHPDFDVRVLSFNNIKDYVDIPQIYYDLLEQKKMSIAHFSDMLRLYLLTTFGGTWVDATLYFTDRIPQSIIDSNFCTVQKDPKTDNFGDRMSCYFIHAKQNSAFTHLTRNALENYWIENRYLIHYFIFEHVVSMIAESSSELEAEWNKMEYLSADDISIFRQFLYKDYDETLFEEIKAKAFMHKLSYKILQDNSSGKSFYDKIVS